MIRRLFAFARYGVILAREIVLSSINVIRLVCGPLDQLRSGFVAVPMEAKSDLEITFFANSITLTPGTITAHIDRERGVLIMHVIDIGQSAEALRRTTKAVLEDSILRWTRPQWPPRDS